MTELQKTINQSILKLFFNDFESNTFHNDYNNKKDRYKLLSLRNYITQDNVCFSKLKRYLTGTITHGTGK